MKRWGKILLWGGLSFYLIGSAIFLGIKYNSLICKEIEIEKNEKNQNEFIEKSDIIAMISKVQKQIIGFPLNKMNLHEIENLISQHPAVRKVEVYKTLDGILHIKIEQRNPILRIINQKNESFYLDEEGFLLPLSQRYAAKVPVANGNISEHFLLKTSKNILNLQTDDSNKPVSITKDLYYLALYLNENKFMKSLISQIYVNNEKKIELIPRMGDFVIVFGNIENFEKKFRNLEIFYRKAVRNVNINQYKQISVEFSNQIVCTFR